MKHKDYIIVFVSIFLITIITGITLHLFNDKEKEDYYNLLESKCEELGGEWYYSGCECHYSVYAQLLDSESGDKYKECLNRCEKLMGYHCYLNGEDIKPERFYNDYINKK